MLVQAAFAALLSFNGFVLHAVSEISIPQCCSNVEADLALKIPAHTHIMQKTPWKPTIFFLDRTTVVLLVFWMHILTCTCSSSCGQNTSRADTYSLDCLLGNLFLYEIKEERRTFERVDIGMKMAWFLYSLSGFGYEHKLVKYLSASWRRLFPLHCSLSQG